MKTRSKSTCMNAPCMRMRTGPRVTGRFGTSTAATTSTKLDWPLAGAPRVGAWEGPLNQITY
eukprot:6445548-Lingulodinium_polyedra.AAC.1